MATSSIFASFDIRDKKTANAFVNALEASVNETAWKPVAPIKPPLTDKGEIMALWKKENQNDMTKIASSFTPSIKYSTILWRV